MTDDAPVLVTVRLDDLRQVLNAATSNPYLGDDGLGLDYLNRLEVAIANSRSSTPVTGGLDANPSGAVDGSDPSRPAS